MKKEINLLDKVCLKYGIIINNNINKDFILLLKDDVIVSLVKIDTTNEISYNFYNLSFFDNKKIELITKTKTIDEIEKFLFDSLFESERIKFNKENLEKIKNFKNQIKFSYTILAKSIKEEVLSKFFNGRKIEKIFDKENKTISFLISKNIARNKSKNIKDNGLKITFDIDGLFNKDKSFLKNIEFLTESSILENIVITMLSNKKIFMNFKEVYLKNIDLFKF